MFENRGVRGVQPLQPLQPVSGQSGVAASALSAGSSAAAPQSIAVRETPARVFLRSVIFVVFYWWLATGAIFALERSVTTRGAGLALALALGGIGVWLLLRSRDDVTPAGSRWSFLGAAFLWSLVQVAFYGGWVVGPESRALHVPAQPATLAFATQAVSAMLWYQLLMLASLAVTWVATGRQRNRTGWWGLLLFYTTHQLACISIFFGVENPGRGFFPKHLEFLESYFGPTQNSLFLPLSVAVLLMLTLAFVVKALRDRAPMRRQAMALLTVLGTLGVIELLVLGLDVNLELWEVFLDFRGQG